MDIQENYAEITTPEIDAMVAGYVHQHFGDETTGYLRVSSNVWRFQEEDFEYNLIITSKLIIFDALLFPNLPENKLELFSDLLNLNAHQTKQGKFCIVKGQVHLRLINEHAHYTFAEFKDNLSEFRWQIPRLRDTLGAKFFKKHKDDDGEETE